VRSERGFSLLELLIVIVIVSILIVAAIDRLLALRYEAERSTVQSVIGALKSALYIEFAASAARKRAPPVAGNPMSLLSERPETYAGEFFGPDPAAFAPGTWYFDSRDASLVYLVRFPEQFTTTLAGPARLRLAVRGDYHAADGKLVGLKLVPLEPYYWKIAGGTKQ
jgi:prepilin-type N-terminal cleavage/methylation domain-containing protein